MWIQENIDKDYSSKTAYWYDDIKVIAKDEQKEFALFFKLCDNFFDDYNNSRGYFEWRK